MDKITEYILSITAAAIICVVVKNITGEKGVSGKLIKTVSGVFMAITVLSPFVNMNIPKLDYIVKDYQLSAEEISNQGRAMADSAMAEIITQQAEAYILNEATKMDVSLDVTVMLTDSQPPVPGSVTVRGDISPYGKRKLSRFIASQLGVSEENQQWT